MDYLNRLSLGVLTTIAGVVGVVVGLLLHAEINTLRQRLAYFFGGLGCTIFLTAPVADWVQIPPDKMPVWLPAIGFALGLFGMALLQRIKHSVDNLDIGEVIKARFNDILSAVRGRK